MRVENADELGRLVRKRRRELRLTQAELAAFCGTSVRFLSELERGRATAGIGLVLHVLASLSLDVDVSPRGSRS